MGISEKCSIRFYLKIVLQICSFIPKTSSFHYTLSKLPQKTLILLSRGYSIPKALFLTSMAIDLKLPKLYIRELRFSGYKQHGRVAYKLQNCLIQSVEDEYAQ